jgi:hypothetical protein
VPESQLQIPNRSTELVTRTRDNDREWLNDLERMVDDFSSNQEQPDGRRVGESIGQFAERIQEMMRPVMTFQ